MQDAIRVVAGDCTVTYERGGEAPTEQRGELLALVKPDNTVLVHDAEGYRPAAWLTRADALRFARDAGGVRLEAGKGDQRLRVEFADCEDAHYPVSPAGTPVGTCPDCGAALVRDGGRLVCTGCRATHRVPGDAEVLEETCPDCGLPRIRVVRGVPVEACADRDCGPLADALAERVGWTCPDCGAPLDVRWRRGVRAVCEACGHGYPVPAGAAAGTCACGLPTFETDAGRRCLDLACERTA